MKSQEKQKIYITLFFFLIFSLIALTFKTVNLLMWSLLGFLMVILLVLSKKISTNISLILFIISLFTFIIFKPALDLFTDTPPRYGEEVYFRTLVLITLSLVGVLIGYLASSSRILLVERERSSSKQLPNSALFLTLITSIFTIISAIQRMLVSQEFGYVAMYAKSNSVINLIENFNLAFIYIYLGTIPNKKQLYRSLIIIIPLLIIDLITGRRGIAIVNMMVLVTYILYRKKNIDKEIIRLNFEIAFKALILLFLIAYISIYISQTRINEFTAGKSILKEFFTQQSSIFDFIQFGVSKETALAEVSSYYSFQAFYNGTFISRLIAKILLPAESFGNQFNNNIGLIVTFLKDPIYFKSGGGLGSSYILELFLDFGYPGVFLYNLFLGWFLKKSTKIASISWVCTTYFLMILRSIYFIPRESTFNWVNQIFSVTNIMAVLIVWILAKVFERILNQ